MWAMNPIPRVAPGIDFDPRSPGQLRNYPGCKAVGGTPVGPYCRQFDPPCPGDHDWYPKLNPSAKSSVVIGASALADDKEENTLSVDQNGTGCTTIEGKCSGDWLGGRIVDRVIIPKNLKAGNYVLGFRWDCEESTQVWSSCADVSVVTA